MPLGHINIFFMFFFYFFDRNHYGGRRSCGTFAINPMIPNEGPGQINLNNGRVISHFDKIYVLDYEFDKKKNSNIFLSFNLISFRTHNSTFVCIIYNRSLINSPRSTSTNSNHNNLYMLQQI